MPNYGFHDSRTSAELLLAPASPLKRITIDTSGVRLDIGGLIPTPGAIMGPGSVTGAIRGSFAAAALTRTVRSGFAGALSATYSSLRSGNYISAGVDPMFWQNSGVAVGGTFDVAGHPITIDADVSSIGTSIAARLPGPLQFVQFSSLRPGQTPGFADRSAVNDRMNQVQAMASRFSMAASSPMGPGVQLLENMGRSTYPLDSQLNIPSFSRLSTGGQVARRESILRDKRRFVTRGVRTASGKPGFWSRLKTIVQAAAMPTMNPIVGQVFRDAFNAGGWSEPAPPYGAQYPYNSAQQTESGHIFELDDTPGAERVHLFHRAGSFIEFHPDGTVVYKSMKDNYMVTMANQNVKVSGHCHIYVGGDTTLYSKGDVDIETEGGVNVHCKKDYNVWARNINLRSKIQFKADGQLINLRYINLPYQIIPTWGALVPMVSLPALRLDFPTGTFDQVVMESLKGPLDEGTLPSLLKFRSDEEARSGEDAPPLLPENPLANPAAYRIKTPRAATYRARFFDAPEECENFEMYGAHIGLQQVLNDIGPGRDPRLLAGTLRDVEPERTLDEAPLVSYLDFNQFAGTFTYEASHTLGNTSFTLADLVDTQFATEVVTAKKTPLESAVELGRDAGQSGPLSANTTDLTDQGRLGSGGINGGLPTQPVGAAYNTRGIPETGLNPWQF